MPSLNKVILAGNLTRDPELKEIGGGKKLCKFSMAINKRFKNAAGEQETRTTFVDVTVWDRQAEACVKYLKKGSAAFVDGALELSQWTTEAGEKRNKLEVVATQVQFLGTKVDAGEGAAPPDVDIPF